MSQVIHIELWLVLIFGVCWVLGSFGLWAMLGVVGRMVRDLRGIAEAMIEKESGK